MSELLDTKVFNKKKFSDILKEIHQRSEEKEEQIAGLIEQLKGLINTTQDALLVVPLIAKYLDISVKNDDILVKMGAIIQKIISEKSGKNDTESSITEEDRKKILELADEFEFTNAQLENKIVDKLKNGNKH